MSRCSICPAVHTCVPPQGPWNSEVMLIGEAPGKDENRVGHPFVGKTGQELDNHFLPLGGLQRERVFVTNAIQCLPQRTDGKLKMQDERDKQLARICAEHHLFEEIERVQPKHIIPMGAFANYVLDESINLSLNHGMPRKLDNFSLFPMWHPAGGIHEPKKMLEIRTDWIRFKKYRYGKLPIWADKFPDTDYKEVTEVSEIRSLAKFSLMGCDTEFDPDEDPVCLTYSIQPGSGRLIRRERTDLLRAFQEILNQWRGIVIFHHWMADKPMVKKMGLNFPDSIALYGRNIIRDSMVRAFSLGNLPKGLKALAYRELGMTMRDFEDVVFPYSIPRILDYYSAIGEGSWTVPEPEEVKDKKTGLWKLTKPHTLNSKIKRFFNDLRREPDKDIIKSWGNWEYMHEEVQAKLGKFYGLDVRDLPLPELIDYACRDADATLRIWGVQEAMVDNMPGRYQEEWRRAVA